MKKIFPALSMSILLLLGACGGKGNSSDTTIANENDSTFTRVKHPEWSRNAVIYEVNLRQYTENSSVTSFTEQLPRLKELGVDILWMMPIHPISKKDRKGELGSYYSVADYKAFNPEFGTIDEFKEMVKKAHQMGMKVILDWVPNHTGRDNNWVTEHPEYYKKDSVGNMIGIYDWTDVYVLDYSNPETRKAMIDAMKFWLTDVDVDGFRCDVAGEVPTDFWDEARPQLEQAKPEIFMLAEDSDHAKKLMVNAFDMGYNWPMKDLFSAIAATSGQYTFKEKDGSIKQFPEKHAIDINNLVAEQETLFPTDSYLMNMITNHDLNSWEGTEFERLGNLTKAFAVLSYTLPGMPMLYTGQETGLNRPLEFFKKDTPPTWEPRNDWFAFYQTLNTLKHAERALDAGIKYTEFVSYATSSPDLYVFTRSKDKSVVTVFTNLGKEEQKVEFTTGNQPDLKGMVDLYTTQKAEMPQSMKPGDFYIFYKK